MKGQTIYKETTIKNVLKWLQGIYICCVSWIYVQSLRSIRSTWNYTMLHDEISKKQVTIVAEKAWIFSSFWGEKTPAFVKVDIRRLHRGILCTNTLNAVSAEVSDSWKCYAPWRVKITWFNIGKSCKILSHLAGFSAFLSSL